MDYLKSLRDEVPLDCVRGKPLIHLKVPKIREHDLVLPEPNAPGQENDDLWELIYEQGIENALGEYGKKPRRKALFWGWIGCGKSVVSEMIATTWGWPLALVQTDVLLTRPPSLHLRHLDEVFRFAERHRTVLVLDGVENTFESREVDFAYCRELDAFQGESLLILHADPDVTWEAIWRRFDFKVMFHRPGTREIYQIIYNRVLGLKKKKMKKDFDLKDLAERMSLFVKSHAEVAKLTDAAVRRMIMAKDEKLSLSHFQLKKSKWSDAWTHFAG